MKSVNNRSGNFNEVIGALEIEKLLRKLGSAQQKDKTNKRDYSEYSESHSNFDGEIAPFEEATCDMDSYDCHSTSLSLGEYSEEHEFKVKGGQGMNHKMEEPKDREVLEMEENKLRDFKAFIDEIMGDAVRPEVDLNVDPETEQEVDPDVEVEEDPEVKLEVNAEDQGVEVVSLMQEAPNGNGKQGDNKFFDLDYDGLDESAALYVAAMHCVPRIGAMTCRALIAATKSAKAAWRVIYDDTLRQALLDEEMRLKVSKICIGRAEAERIFYNLQRDLHVHKIGLLSYLDPDFPEQLENIYNPPAILFYKGNIGLLKGTKKSVAMVGARACSMYGRQVAHTFAKYFSEQGVIVISGGARGIDTQSHQGALDAKCTPTIVVMGCGLAITYPSNNKSLFASIIENHGLLLSEYPPYVPANAMNFPLRNRLISGLARATIVVEAKKSSGSLITADMATNDGRDVYTIPGNVLNHFADGNHWLLRMGATPLSHPKYLLEDYGWNGEDPLKKEYMEAYTPIRGGDDSICKYLSVSEAVSIDDLIHKTELSHEKIYDILVKLEIQGLIKRVGSQSYVLVAHLS